MTPLLLREIPETNRAELDWLRCVHCHVPTRLVAESALLPFCCDTHAVQQARQPRSSEAARQAVREIVALACETAVLTRRLDACVGEPSLRELRGETLARLCSLVVAVNDLLARLEQAILVRTEYARQTVLRLLSQEQEAMRRALLAALGPTVEFLRLVRDSALRLGVAIRHDALKYNFVCFA
jgi:hypothetical protein